MHSLLSVELEQILKRMGASTFEERAELARDFQMLGILSLSSRPSRIQDAVRMAAYRAECKRNNLRITEELLRLVKLLDAQDLPILVLKGPPYMALSYQRDDVRIIGDIDLLVPAESLARVLELLTAQGYRWKIQNATIAHIESYISSSRQLRHIPRMYSTGTRELRNPNFGLDLHINHIDAPPEVSDARFAALYDRSVSQQLRTGQVQVLSHEDTVVHALIHIAWHYGQEFLRLCASGEAKHPTRLLLLHQLASYIGNSPALNWTTIRQIIQDFAVTTEASFALNQLQFAFPSVDIDWRSLEPLSDFSLEDNPTFQRVLMQHMTLSGQIERTFHSTTGYLPLVRELQKTLLMKVSRTRIEHQVYDEASGNMFSGIAPIFGSPPTLEWGDPSSLSEVPDCKVYMCWTNFAGKPSIMLGLKVLHPSESDNFTLEAAFDSEAYESGIPIVFGLLATFTESHGHLTPLTVPGIVDHPAIGNVSSCTVEITTGQDCLWYTLIVPECFLNTAFNNGSTLGVSMALRTNKDGDTLASLGTRTHSQRWSWSKIVVADYVGFDLLAMERIVLKSEGNAL